MKTDQRQVATVDDYIAAFPRPVRTVLDQVRRTIRSALPRAEESISYRIPTYKLFGRPVLYFAAFKQHYSLYPSSAQLVAAFKRELAPYELDKGTIRFPLGEPVPLKLIARIAKFRAEQVAAKETWAAATPKKPRRRAS